MKKKVRLIVLLMVLALAVSFLGSIGNFGGSWFGESSHKHNSGGSSVTPPEDDSEDPGEPSDPTDPVDPVSYVITLSEEGIVSCSPTYSNSVAVTIRTIDGKYVIGYVGYLPSDDSYYMYQGRSYYAEVVIAKIKYTSNTITYKYETTNKNFVVCPECNSVYDVTFYASCPNCSSVVVPPEPDPMTVCPECNQEYNTQTYSACPNPDCPLNQSMETKCTVCGIGYLSEGNGVCSNPDCPTNKPVTTQKCSSCGTELVDGECPNEDCPLKYDPTTPCTVCNNGYLNEGNGVCSNPNCPTNNPTTKQKCSYCDTEFVDGECPNPDCPSKYDPTTPCTVCNNGYYTEESVNCSNPDCPTNKPPVVTEKCSSCGTELVDGECPNEDCPLKYDPTTPCTVCNSGYLNEGNGICSNPDCPTNNPTTTEKCSSCGTELVDGECPNADCPSKYDPTTPCTVCNNGYYTEAGASCSNPDCPTNKPPVVTEKCSSCDTELVDGVCPNEDCPSKVDPTIPCTVCNNGYYTEAGASCSNPDCPTNNPTTTEKCSSCNTELVDGECPNEDCPLKHENTTPCTVCNNGYLNEGSNVCSNPDCPTNNAGTPQLPEGVYLFENQYLTTEPNGALPIPTPGVSYTCFVDGVEIGTTVADTDGYIGFVSWDENGGSVPYVLHYTDMGGWFFHPVESSITTGYVSVRVNGVGSGDGDYPICTVCGNGYTEAGADCNNPDCPSQHPDTMVDCPMCGEYYDSSIYDYCQNPDCTEYVEVRYCPVCGTGVLSEANDICSNAYCPSIFSVTLTEQGIAYANTLDGCWYLYDASDDTCVAEELATNSPVDFSDDMESGKSYYVILSGVTELDGVGEFRSETIVYKTEGFDYEYGQCSECGSALSEAGNCSNPDCPFHQ